MRAAGPSLELAVPDDMHNHHRRDDTDATKGHRLEAAAESTFAKLLARVVTPFLVAIIGYFLVGTMEDIKEAQQQLHRGQIDQGAEITQIRTELAVVNIRMDERVLRQVDANSKVIESHERRLQALERTR